MANINKMSTLWGGGYNELVYYFLLRQITFISRVNNLSKHCRAVIGLRDRDHMIIEFTATYAIDAFYI
jgi:hypothetical protein